MKRILWNFLAGAVAALATSSILIFLLALSRGMSYFEAGFGVSFAALAIFSVWAFTAAGVVWGLARISVRGARNQLRWMAALGIGSSVALWLLSMVPQLAAPIGKVVPWGALPFLAGLLAVVFCGTVRLFLVIGRKDEEKR